jgi:hypothetical protein
VSASQNVPDCYLNPQDPGDNYDIEIELEKRTSWDPNEKAAPAGFGPRGFISSAGRMHYQIYFENLATAQAPAWRVIIVDTLSAAFDPSTVEFGPTSHEGPQFEWTMTRDDNVLLWEIEDIVLAITCSGTADLI